MASTTRTSDRTAPSARERPVPYAPRWRLGRRLRRTVLLLHVVSAGAWIGVDVIVAVLVLTGWFGSGTAVRGLAYQALARFVVWPMLLSGLTCLLTGVVLGLATRWGLIRYWWVAIKLVANLVLCTLIVFVLWPGMADVDAYGRELAAGEAAHGSVSYLFFPPAVSLTVLSLASALAVFRPWGRIRP